MATVNLGSIKFNWKGSYSGATAYVVDDVVESSGSSYICIAATTGNAPPNASYWEQMSSKGTDADLLSIASTVQGDIYYNSGGAIARLGAGTNGQFLKTQGTGANPQWGDVATDHSGVAWFEYQYGTGQFGDMHSIAGYTGSHDRVTIPWNTLTDPYNIIGTAGSNTFQVNSTGLYEVTFGFRLHQFNHYKIFAYNDTDSKYAERPNATLTGTAGFQAPFVGYNTGQGEVSNNDDFYYFETGHTYSWRGSNDTGTSNFNTTTAYLLGNHTAGGINSYNTIFRVKVTKMSGV